MSMDESHAEDGVAREREAEGGAVGAVEATVMSGSPSPSGVRAWLQAAFDFLRSAALVPGLADAPGRIRPYLSK